MRNMLGILFLLLAGGMCLADWTIVNRLPFDANAIEPEFAWLAADPNLYTSLFDCYSAETGLPYAHLIWEHWLEYNPLLYCTTPIGGVKWAKVYVRGLHGMSTDLHPLEIGNLNGDDAIDLRDFAVWAAHYRRGAPTAGGSG